MRIWPRSLFGRLFAVAAITTIAALAFAALTIGHVLERFVTHSLDQQLDAQVAVLARAVGPDGRIDPSRVVDLPAFDAAGSGWGWRVDGPKGRWSRGASFEPDPEGWFRHGEHHPRDDRTDDMEPRPGEGRDQGGGRVHFRQRRVTTAAGPVVVTAAGPRRVSEQPLREAMAPLLLSLALLGCALAMATLLQLRFGLRPLRMLRRDLAAVREGRARHIPGGQPAEIAPLAAELNALIDQNEAGLAHARRHVANLAHGLKTPLAALGVRLAEPGRDPDGELAEMVARIDRRLRHHLGRARAAVPGGSHRLRTALAPAVSDLVHALSRINADRAITAKMSVATDVVVAVDPQDLDEMIGNLLDNAWRHARSRVEIEAEERRGSVVIDIADDGAGLPPAFVEEAMLPGRRLDERGEGHGFGLPIARELAELNGGNLTIGRSARLGGLDATLVLPMPSGAGDPSDSSHERDDDGA